MQDHAREYSEESIETLVAMMRDEGAEGRPMNPTARIGAARELLDRAWGKPAQTQNVNVIKRDIRQLTRAELEQAVALDEQALAQERAAQEAGRSGKPNQVH